MSRSSVVWGPFSIVWGLALAAATLFLYKYRDRSASFFFVAGPLLGGLYEYLCSVFTELVFGTVFWDYSAIPFNLGGRINLLYCFFWGFAAVAWFRGLYPILARWIAKIPPRPGQAVVWRRLHVRQYGVQRPGPGTLQRPGRRRARRRGLGAVHGCPLR